MKRVNPTSDATGQAVAVPKTQRVPFPTALGWMAVLIRDDRLAGLTFGHRSAAAARQALGAADVDCAEPSACWIDDLIAKLRKLATGSAVDFGDVPVDLGVCTRFRRVVLEQCRAIRWGEQVTYGELAARAGTPRAARAVGNVMAQNSIPLVIPCHRVVRTGGSLGGFSAPGGKTTKEKLLELERVT